MAYVKKIWKDYPDATTPILASDMSNIENGIEAVDTALETIENNVNNIEDGLETVTNNVNNGWISLNGTFTYVSWYSSVHTGVVSSNLDLTPYLSVGMKVKFTQNSEIKYGFITKISSSQITLYMGNNYTLNSSGISNTFYSMVKAPYGFPLSQTVWTLESSLTTPQLISNPVSGTVYNPGNFQIVCPIGDWEISYKVNNYTVRSSSGVVEQYTNLSTSTTAFTGDMGCQSINFAGSVSKIMALGMNSGLKRYETPTTIYCCTRTAGTGITDLGFYQTDYNGSYGPAYIRLKPAYL
jgi:hypothetical protein